MSPHRRLLHEYPTGARRRVLLAVVVLALFISAYEGQLAPVLPLLLSDLGMSLATYGQITALSLLFGAVSGYLGGELVDRIGRVRVLVPFMFLSAAACLFMALSQSVEHFIAARILLAFVEGVAMAGTQPLIRDFTPRMGRAQAFAFWSWGPAGANFFAAAVAALTLDLFGGSWRAQILLMTCTAFVGAVIVALTLRDLSPQLRRTIRLTERTTRGSGGAVPAGHPLRLLLRHRVIWAHVGAMSLLYVFLSTMNAYGQTLLAEHFGVTVRTASAIVMVFWASNLVASLVFARLSDRTQRRKPFLVGGGVAATLLLGVFVLTMGAGASVPPALVIALLTAVGISLGTVFGPWMASFSEYTEEVHPDAQGVAFGLSHFVSRLFIFVAVLLAPVVVAAGDWRLWTVVTLVTTAGFALVVTQVQGGPSRARRVPVSAPTHSEPERAPDA
ncbi:MFS transporter [Nocardiopsis aegyptia]|uniref:OPA family glycerol-3-phosphate transporter-like MFS transporter n=1 Tax=Nocardiopsis aegyptia TaxID=220378 RepID=A0A7Z0J7Q8_9ACTN|nr:MFS transporter [Nocardiopsis aegyptia]NYJ32146.1 OPA family glycerol-3-phosphate transporter-like MFS transporter [Nocardiopsis aegyptia]